MNSTLDIQWQPRNDLAIDIGYVNGLGRHEVIPIPFNQARIASPTNPLCGPAAVCANPTGSPFVQSYTYGYTVQTLCKPWFPRLYLAAARGQWPAGSANAVNSEGGNVDHASSLYRLRGGVGVCISPKEYPPITLSRLTSKKG